MGLFDNAVLVGKGRVREIDGYYDWSFDVFYDIYAFEDRIVAARPFPRYVRQRTGLFSSRKVQVGTDYEIHVVSEQAALKMLLDNGVPMAECVSKLRNHRPTQGTVK